MDELFRSLHIQIDVEGDPSIFKSPDGLLLVGSHHQKYESYPLLALAGSSGRNDLYHIALPPPFSKSSLVSVLLDPLHFGYVLPVLHRQPNHRAGDFFSMLRSTVSKMAFADGSYFNEVRKQLNFHSLQKAAELLKKGHMVSIFPTGNPDKSMKDFWYPGIGTIVGSLNPKKARQVKIVPHTIDSQLIEVLHGAQRDFMAGNKPVERHIRMRIGNPRRAAQFQRATVQETTQAVKDYYLQELSIT
jgi:hypothetical protein